MPGNRLVLLTGYLGQRYGDYRPDLRGGGPFDGEGSPLSNMPIALIRLAVTRENLTRDMDIKRKFYGELPEK